MCEPATISATTMAYIAMASAAASAVAGLYTQTQVSKSQREQEKQAMIQRNYNLASLQRRYRQEVEGASQKINENNKKAMQAQSRAFATAGENGISGLSVDALMRDLGGERDDYNLAVRENLNRNLIAINQQRDNTNIQANSQFAQLTRKQPDYLGAALKIVDTTTTYGDKAGWWNINGK